MPQCPAWARLDADDCFLASGPNPHPAFGGASRLRLATFDRIAEIRAWFAEQGREEFLWWIGPSARPPGLAAELLARGACVFSEEPQVEAMLATQPPPAVEGVDVRPVQTLDEFAAMQELTWEVNHFTEEQRTAGRNRRELSWAEWDPTTFQAFVVWIDDEAVALGMAAYTPFGVALTGAATREQTRGRGYFRALVRARWDEGVRRGTPALIVYAGHMSQPILRRLGFRSVATVDVLLDRP
jgi:hypothetical protein